MNIQRATQDCEAWLGEQTTLVFPNVCSELAELLGPLADEIEGERSLTPAAGGGLGNGHLARQPKKWLPRAMEAMTKSSKQDYEAWPREASSKATSAKNS